MKNDTLPWLQCIHSQLPNNKNNQSDFLPCPHLFNYSLCFQSDFSSFFLPSLHIGPYHCSLVNATVIHCSANVTNYTLDILLLQDIHPGPLDSGDSHSRDK